MADISAQDVAALRKATGAGMMDCKKALEESSGDLEAAQTWLREKGLSGAAKRAGREATDGAVDAVVEGGVGVVVEVNCETDFVAKGDEFGAFVSDLAQHVLEHGDDDLPRQAFDGSTVEEAVVQLGAKVGEKVELGRVVRIAASDGIVDGYKHIQNERGVIGVLIHLAGVGSDDERAREVAHDLALHIASQRPRWRTREEIPAEVVDAERQVLENLTRNEGKPEEQIPKIVEGRLGGFYRDNVLLEQAFVRDPKQRVSALLEGLGGVEVAAFARVEVGED